MIFHQHKCIFFHVPKTAGYSIERFLDNQEQRNFNIYYDDVVYGFKDGVYSQHFNYPLMKEIIDESIMNKYFKFCFVRNTYDRLVSAFTYSPVQIKNKKTFKQHLKQIQEIFPILHPTHHFSSQMKYILDGDNIMVDYIGRYENLQEDMKNICEKIKVEYKPLPKMNASQRTHYRDYYDNETLDLVNNMYTEEIDYFNFKF